jgi:CRISPR system Cascade subunit CasD
MTATLLMRLDGPLQSWGVASLYARRDTLDHPSKSGVIGLCAAALGRGREDEIGDLAGLRHGVLVVDPGRVIQDYHTVSNVIRGSKASRVDLTPSAVMRLWSASEIRGEKLPSVGDVTGVVKATELTWRSYLADAMFVAGLEGPLAVLEEVREALGRPAFPLCLGRASCLPSAPVDFRERPDGGLVDLPLVEALESLVLDAVGWLESRHPAGGPERRHRARAQRIIVECDSDQATLRVRDQPQDASSGSRQFTLRYARVVPVGRSSDA